ncbi:MAG: hypothetical protein GWO24_34930, partial [Akkermansiaceae bacterium]|nr:hypothetical protein [Akkermansiaceae bacterium]
DPNLPLMVWWGIEKHCDDAGRADVLRIFRSDPEIWEKPMVQREILPRLMRRFALQGREADLLVCADLLRMAPGPAARKTLMKGFEQAFAGGPLPGLPGDLVAALAEFGELSLELRVRRGDEDAVAEAIAIAGNQNAVPAERWRYIRAFGEAGPPSTLQVLLGIVREEEDAALRQAALAALSRFASDEVARVVTAVHSSLTGEERVAAEALLASRLSWSRAWLTAIEAGVVAAGGTSPEAIAILRRHDDVELAKSVAKHFGESGATGPPAAARVEEIREIVEDAPGSPYRGRPLFKQRCASCHVLFYSGGKLGPDLTSYQRDDLETMLTSIVDPNAEIREGF